MKRITFILLFTFSVSAFGQNQYIGFKGGISYSNVNTKDSFDEKDLNYRTAFIGELFYNYFITNNLSFTSGIGYDQRGFSIDADIKDYEGIFITSYTIDLNYDYLYVPLVFGYTSNGIFHFFGNLGIIPSYIISAKTEAPFINNDGTVTDTEFDVRDRVTQFDFGGFAEAGIGYHINNSYTISFSISYNRSFNSITNSKYFSEDKIFNYGVNFLFGIKYKFRD